MTTVHALDLRKTVKRKCVAFDNTGLNKKGSSAIPFQCDLIPAFKTSIFPQLSDAFCSCKQASLLKGQHHLQSSPVPCCHTKSKRPDYVQINFSSCRRRIMHTLSIQWRAQKIRQGKYKRISLLLAVRGNSLVNVTYDCTGKQSSHQLLFTSHLDSFDPCKEDKSCFKCPFTVGWFNTHQHVYMFWKNKQTCKHMCVSLLAVGMVHGAKYQQSWTCNIPNELIWSHCWPSFCLIRHALCPLPLLFASYEIHIHLRRYNPEEAEKKNRNEMDFLPFNCFARQTLLVVSWAARYWTSRGCLSDRSC